MENQIVELLAKFDDRIQELERIYRKGCLTPFEYSKRIVDIYNQYVTEIGTMIVDNHVDKTLGDNMKGK